MLDGYRGIIAATGLAGISLAFGLGLYLASLNYPNEVRHQPYRYAADKPIEIPAPGAIPGQAFEYREPCQNPKGNNESDLCAQWRAAKAAEESALWTKWGFWVGIGGMLGLFLTLFYTREAVKDTGDATAAMIRQNEIAEAAQRPWVMPEEVLRPIVRNSIYHGSFVSNSIGFIVQWKNTGATEECIDVRVAFSRAT